MLRAKLKPSAMDGAVREKLKTVPDQVLGAVKDLFAGEVQAHQASRDFVQSQGLKLKRADFSEDVACQRVYQRLWSLVEQEERRRAAVILP
jgi:hypothetical protein